MKLKKVCSIVMIMVTMIILFLIFGDNYEAFCEGKEYFSDIPENHWIEQYIYDLKELGIIKGKTYEEEKLILGIEEDITRSQFMVMLVRFLGIEGEGDFEIRFTDVSSGDWYYEDIKKAIYKGIIVQEEYRDLKFNPDTYITREEMTVMIVRALGCDFLAKELEASNLEFYDVYEYRGYINVAKNFGIVNGRYRDNEGRINFAPKENALKTEAVAMISRMKKIMDNKIKTSNGFYAISSYSQIEKIKEFDSIGFGWCGLDYDEKSNQVILSTKKSLKNDYYLPEGYMEPYERAVGFNKKVYLMIYGNNSTVKVNSDKEIRLLTELLSREENSKNLINNIIENAQSMGDEGNIEFDGVIIDFEGLKDREKIKEKFSFFLDRLRDELKKINKELIVCLHPIRENRSYYDGYDYRRISEIADRIILMAHDYNPKKINNLAIDIEGGAFPSAPIKEVYEGIKLALENGVAKEKIILQLSLSKELWKPDDNGSDEWNREYISYGDIFSILDSEQKFETSLDERYMVPYITFKNEEGRINKIISYEDTRSINEKIKIAKYFGLEGISIWRLGLIGDKEHDKENKYFLDIWSEIESLSK